MANPLETVDDILATAEAIEEELAKTGPHGASALAIASPSTGDQEEDAFGYEESLACLYAKVEDLVAAVQRCRRKPPDRSKIHCYMCQRYGHFRNECKEPQRPSTEEDMGLLGVLIGWGVALHLLQDIGDGKTPSNLDLVPSLKDQRTTPTIPL